MTNKPKEWIHSFTLGPLHSGFYSRYGSIQTELFKILVSSRCMTIEVPTSGRHQAWDMPPSFSSKHIDGRVLEIENYISRETPDWEKYF